jgi:hypothetical protein
MPSEIENIIAFLFKRSGKEQISHSEFYLTLSMNLNWFTPDTAKQFVEMAIKKKYLSKNKDQLKPTFDVAQIKVPVGFHPSKTVFEKKKSEEKQEILQEIISKFSEKTDLDEDAFLERIVSVAKEKNITNEIAALLIGREYDVSLEEIFNKIEEKLLTENKE